jgi:hypothetical protein
MPGAAFRERRTRGPAADSFQVSEGKRSPRPEFSRARSSGDAKWKRPIPFPMPLARSEAAPRPFSRDPTPRLSNLASRTFPSPDTAALTRRGTREPARYAEIARTISEETIVEDGNLESEVSYSDYACEELRDNKSRRSKITHKERGSLRRVYRDDVPPSRNRDAPAKSHAQVVRPKGKPKILNKTKREVFIPSIVSVGNLARILGVSLSGLCFIRERSEYSLPC